MSQDERIEERIRTLTKVWDKVSADNHKISAGVYLDIGCSDGSVTLGIGNYLGADIIYGADIKPNCVKEEGIVFLQVVNDKIDLDDDTVDFITCFVCMHHFIDIEVMLKEITRILKPGGYFYIRDHDIVTMNDYTTVELIHCIFEVKQNVISYHDSYFSLDNLRSYLRSNEYDQVSTVYYDKPNPQRIFHSLFHYLPSNKNQYIDNNGFTLVTNNHRRNNGKFDIFKSYIDPIYWLQNKWSKLHRPIVLKIHNMYGINYKQAKVLLGQSKNKNHFIQSLHNQLLFD